MRIPALLLVLVCKLGAADGWTPLFNGKDLTGWQGDARLWRVEDGTIVGETDDEERKVGANSFLVWQEGEPGDFELEFEARVSGENNSGVQYRSRMLADPEWALAGYQMDLHPNAPYLAMLYEERGRGIVCERGSRIKRLADGSREVGKLPVPEVKLAEWNRYRVVAEGPLLRHYVNGELAAEVRDLDEAKRTMAGKIGLQLHAGPPMKVEFRNIRLKDLKAAEESSSEDATSDFQVAPGFKLERVYRVPAEQGSWVAMTVDGAGRLLCVDQYGKVYRVTPGGAGMAVKRVEPLENVPGGAHGLLWHRGTLYVTVNENEGGQSGVWAVKETEDRYGEPRLLKAMSGRGEHGPHALVASPDGGWIYFVAGNHTDLAEMDESYPARSWGEDQLLPRNPDGRGHARDRMAPGGWVARFRPDGSRWELVSVGFRNAYDIAFAHDGSLFAYDADMEWDFGMPWYRPTRICHVLAGSEFGWRNGTGKWPDYYEDSMNSVLDIGPGSPTGLLSGKGLGFPAAYQKALYALDWTFATIHVIHLKPGGEGYTAERSELVAGMGLPLTDAVAGADGAMYFTTGGRRLDSSLWRVTYTGGGDVSPLPEEAPREGKVAAMERAVLEPDAGQLEEIWSGLASPDRTLRQAARLALERQPVGSWRGRVEREIEPWSVIASSIALARCGADGDAALALAALDRVDWETLDEPRKLAWLRAVGLVFIRHGKPDAAARDAVLAKIDPRFPSGSPVLDAELCRVLCYLDAPGVISRTLALLASAPPPEAPDWAEFASRNESYGQSIRKMLENHPPTAQVHFIYCLRVVKGPWKDSERRAVFDWFREASTREGGNSYAGFIDGLRRDFLAGMTEEERVKYAAESAAPAAPVLTNLPPVEGPGRSWTVEEVVKTAAEGLDGRDLEKGKRMFQASLCAACHRLSGEGGASGPDLNALGGRFTVRDIAVAILDPGAEVSDQFAFDEIRKHDGTTLTGKVINEQDELLVVAVNAFDFTQTTEIPRSDIAEIKLSPVSPMPGGLINRLNPDELKDLLAYLMGKE